MAFLGKRLTIPPVQAEDSVLNSEAWRTNRTYQEDDGLAQKFNISLPSFSAVA
jgi:hypothetical protein